MAETMTINVDENVVREFRRLAGIKFGKRKGYLGKALNAAMSSWLASQEGEDIDLQAIAELKKGFHLGKLKYRSRGELHER